MQLGRVRWANAELLACQAKDAMRRLKLTTLKLRLTREKQLAIADAGAAAAAAQSEGETSSRRACGSRKVD